MKKLLILFFLLTSFMVQAQIQPAPPTGSKPYGTTTYISPDGLLWYGTNPLKYRGVYPKTKVDSLLALIPIFDSSLYYTKTQSDERFVSLTGTYANPSWITSLDYGKLINVPPITIPNLQSVTNGIGNNVTSNIIQLTGLENLDLTKGGGILGYDDVNTSSVILGLINGGAINHLRIGNNDAAFIMGSLEVLSLREELTNIAGAGFSSRVKGNEAINSNEFTTLAQVNELISDIPPIDLTPYELIVNKQNSLIADGTGVKYTTVDAVNSGLGLKANLAGGNIFTGGNQTIEGNLYLPFNRWMSYNNTLPLAPVHIGNRNVLNSSNAQILVAGTYDNSFATSGHAFSDGTLITGVGSSKAYAGYDGRVDIQGTDVDMDHYVSFQHGPSLNFTGTLKDNFGLYTNTLIQGGNLTNNYGAYLANPTKTGGIITNNYGLYIPNQTAGSNNWSLYSEDGFNYFGGSMQIDGTQSLNSTGQNLRIKSDGTNANDGGFYVNSIGNIQVGNWDGTRGFVSLGNGNGYYFGGNFGVKTATPLEALDVAGKALVSDAPTVPTGVVRLGDLDIYELKSNKQNSLVVDASNLKYPTVTAVNTGLATKQNTLGFTPENVVNKVGDLTAPSSTTYLNTLGLKNALDEKVNTSVPITGGYGITVGGDLSSAISVGLNTTTTDNRYLRKDQNDNNGVNTLTLGGLISSTATIEGDLILPSLPIGTSNDILVIDGSGVVQKKELVIAGDFGVADAAGTNQFNVPLGTNLRFEGANDTQVSFDPITNKVTISSVPGSGGGGAVVSWNSRVGAVVPVTGDYNSSMVPEMTNLYFTEPRVRTTPLTGFTANNTAIIATDNVIQAFGKAQGQINNKVSTSRELTIAGTAGRLLVSGAETQNLSANPSWTLDLATVGTAGTYKSVTTDGYGRVISGTNPTTLGGFGITDAYTKTESDALFPLKDGTGATGTWGINISGASYATQYWGSWQADFSSQGTAPTYMLGYESDVVKPYDVTKTRAWLGIPTTLDLQSVTALGNTTSTSISANNFYASIADAPFSGNAFSFGNGFDGTKPFHIGMDGGGNQYGLAIRIGSTTLAKFNANGNLLVGGDGNDDLSGSKIQVTGNITANNFIGNLNGNATTATNANNASLWNGYANDFSVIQTASPSYVIGMDGVGAIKRYNSTAIVDLISGFTLNNSISGNAATATNSTNAANWNNILGVFTTPQSGTIANPIAIDVNGSAYKYTVGAFNTWLGSPSGGETLQSVTDRGNITTKGISAENYNIGSGAGTRGSLAHDDLISQLYLQNYKTDGIISLYPTPTVRAMDILANGNVGIGTTTPSDKLSVNGNISTTSSVISGNSGGRISMASGTSSGANSISSLTSDGSIYQGLNLYGEYITMYNPTGSDFAPINVGTITAPRLIGSADKWANIGYGGVASSGGISHIFGYDSVTSGEAKIMTIADFKTQLEIPSALDLQGVTDLGSITTNSITSSGITLTTTGGLANTSVINNNSSFGTVFTSRGPDNSTQGGFAFNVSRADGSVTNTLLSINNAISGPVAKFSLAVDAAGLILTSGSKIGSLQAPVADGSFTYNLPSANGTLALTSELANFVNTTGDQTGILGNKTWEGTQWIGNTSGNYSRIAPTNVRVSDNTGNSFTLEKTQISINKTGFATSYIRTPSPVSERVWTFPDATGTLALTSQFESGTYTPAFTNISNVTSITLSLCHYKRIGNEVTVSGSFSDLITVSGGQQFTLSLPITSNLTNSENDLTGFGNVANNIGGINIALQASGNTTTDTAHFSMESGAATSGSGRFSFSYTVK